VEVGFYDTPGRARKVAVSDNYAYVADLDAGLRIVNIQDPTNPTEIGFYDTPGGAWDVSVSGAYAYIADYYSLRVICILDPVNPVEVGYYDTPGYTIGIMVLDNYAYVVNDGAGIQIFNIQDPTTPYELGFYNTPGHAYGITASGSYAYVADYFYFEIFDCSQALSVPNHNPVKAPFTYSLLPAYPNPFNSATRISYSVAAGGRVQLVVFDLLGRRVGTLVDRTLAPGNYSLNWDTGNLASGIYFCRMSVKTPTGGAGGLQQIQKLTLLK
jgi:hypothetical protein